MVLRRGAQHRRPANIDVLDAIREVGPTLARDDRAEGVEVAGDEVDRREAVARQRLLVCGQITTREDARVHGRVKRFHAAVEHLGQARDRFDLRNGDTSGFDRTVRAPGRDHLPAELDEPAGERFDTSLVVDAEQRAHRTSSLPLGRRVP